MMRLIEEGTLEGYRDDEVDRRGNFRGTYR